MTTEFQKILNKMTEQEIKGSPGGIASKFVKLNDSIGVKLYRYKDERDGCMERQTDAAAHGLGPEVYGKIDIDTPHFKYGYLTECTPVVNDKFFKKIQGCWMPLYGPCFPSFGIEKLDGPVPIREIDFEKLDIVESTLNDIMAALCWDFADCHMGNWGVKDGRLVMIDFGDESVVT